MNRTFVSATLLLMSLLPACASGPYQASAQDQQQRQQAVAQYGSVIVPGVGIGPVNLGMAMDEVRARLGEPDNTSVDPEGNVISWGYGSLNLTVGFTVSATPSVNSVSTSVNVKKPVTLGAQTWEDGYPVQTVFQLDNGIKLGATSFDVQRAFGDYSEPGGSAGLMMQYPNGLLFRVTKSDHRVVQIEVENF
jgi:hypothetical protein